MVEEKPGKIKHSPICRKGYYRSVLYRQILSAILDLLRYNVSKGHSNSTVIVNQFCDCQ